MNAPHRPLFFAVVPLMLAALPAVAFTDGNAELREAAADRSARGVVTGRATPARTAWVPLTPKALDGFRPPPQQQPATTTVARAGAPAQKR